MKFLEKIQDKAKELKNADADFDESVEKLSDIIFRHSIAKTRGLSGFEFGEAIEEIMYDLGHPHARYTLEQVRGNYKQGTLTTREFGLECARTMAHLISTNLLYPEPDQDGNVWIK